MTEKKRKIRNMIDVLWKAPTYEEFGTLFNSCISQSQLDTYDKVLEVIGDDEKVKTPKSLSEQIVYGYKPIFRNELRLFLRKSIEEEKEKL